MAEERHSDPCDHPQFTDLPLEIRLQIYKLTFPSIVNVGTYRLGPNKTSDSDKTSKYVFRFSRFSALFAVSRQVRTEAIKPFLRQTTFTYSIVITSACNDAGVTELLRVLEDKTPLNDMRNIMLEVRRELDYGPRCSIDLNSLTNYFMIYWHGKHNEGVAKLSWRFYQHDYMDVYTTSNGIFPSPWLHSYALGRLLRLKEEYNDGFCYARAVTAKTSLGAVLTDAVSILMALTVDAVFY